jgi:hypothetical protein
VTIIDGRNTSNISLDISIENFRKTLPKNLELHYYQSGCGLPDNGWVIRYKGYFIFKRPEIDFIDDKFVVRGLKDVDLAKRLNILYPNVKIYAYDSKVIEALNNDY